MATAGEQKRLDGVLLHRFDIRICDAEDLLKLADYNIVIVVDDSSSMGRLSMPRRPRIGVKHPTRWAELRETLQLLIEIGTCLDADGVDIHFLNAGNVRGVTSPKDANLDAVLERGPAGSTPLTETVRRVVAELPPDKPVIMVILTDGEPNGGPQPFMEVVKWAIDEKGVRFQIMACTGDEKELAWLDRFDRAFLEVDVTDDYATEREQVLRARRVRTFSRGDWIMKALLACVDMRFDLMDEAPRGIASCSGGCQIS